MRKKPESDFFERGRSLKDVKHRLHRYAMLACVLFLPGIVWGQEQKVTLHFKDAPVQDVLKEINRQTGLDFVYNLTQLQEINPVTVNVENVTVDAALTQLLKDTPYKHQFEMGSIIIRRQETRPVQQDMKELKGQVKDQLFNGVLTRFTEVEDILRVIEQTATVKFEVKGTTVIVK